jgi:hypothetical protein
MRAVERQATEALLGAVPEALSLSPLHTRRSFATSCEGTLVSDHAEWVREELARQGVAVDGDDLTAIVKMVGTNRAALAAALARVDEEPDVSHGFVPPVLMPGVEREGR